MIPFPFNENRFSFFVAHDLLVGQLCTNPKSDRSLLSCLKVTQCSTREIRDAPLYNHCSLPIQVMTVGLYVNTKVYLDVLKSVVILWYKQGAGGRPWMWQQDSAPAHKFKDTHAWLQKECYDFVPFSHWRGGGEDSERRVKSRPEPAGQLCLVIRREHHQHDLPQH